MSKTRFYIMFAVLSMAGYLWLGWNMSGSAASSTSVCLFREVTGVPCPSCGATRAVLLVMQGQLWQSLLVNPLGFMLALGLLVVPTWMFLDVVRRGDSCYRVYGAAERILLQKKWLSIAAGLVVLLNWCWNVAKGL